MMYFWTSKEMSSKTLLWWHSVITSVRQKGVIQMMAYLSNLSLGFRFLGFSNSLLLLWILSNSYAANRRAASWTGALDDREHAQSEWLVFVSSCDDFLTFRLLKWCARSRKSKKAAAKLAFFGPVKLTTEHDSYDPNAEILQSKTHVLRWLDTVFLGQYLPSLSINYVAISKDLEKLPPQLY